MLHTNLWYPHDSNYMKQHLWLMQSEKEALTELQLYYSKWSVCKTVLQQQQTVALCWMPPTPFCSWASREGDPLTGEDIIISSV